MIIGLHTYEERSTVFHPPAGRPQLLRPWRLSGEEKRTRNENEWMTFGEAGWMNNSNLNKKMNGMNCSRRRRRLMESGEEWSAGNHHSQEDWTTWCHPCLGGSSKTFLAWLLQLGGPVGWDWWVFFYKRGQGQPLKLSSNHVQVKEGGVNCLRRGGGSFIHQWLHHHLLVVTIHIQERSVFKIAHLFNPSLLDV